jgi:hypothetical protein
MSESRPITSPMGGQTPGQDIQTREERLDALHMRKAGLSYTQIGRQLGMTKAGAHKLVKTALEELRSATTEAAADVIQLELERLDAMLMGLWAPATRGDGGAVDRVLKIMERRSRLLGLDQQPGGLEGGLGGSEQEPIPVGEMTTRLSMVLQMALEEQRALPGWTAAEATDDRDEPRTASGDAGVA